MCIFTTRVNCVGFKVSPTPRSCSTTDTQLGISDAGTDSRLVRICRKFDGRVAGGVRNVSRPIYAAALNLVQYGVKRQSSTRVTDAPQKRGLFSRLRRTLSTAF